MRCLACGGEMMAVASDDAVGVDGFKGGALSGVLETGNSENSKANSRNQ